jgi:integrase
MVNENAKKRGHGDGCITQQKDGRWVARIQIGKTHDGKPKVKALYGKTEPEVRKKLREYKKVMAQGINEAIKMTVSQYIERWLINYKQNSLKPASYDRMEGVLNNYIKNTIGIYQMGNLTSNDIQKLINEKSKTLSYSSVKKIIELLRPCFKHAVLVGDLNKNPCDAVSLPRQSSMVVKTKTIDILTDTEIDIIKKSADHITDKKSHKHKHAPVFVLILNTGIRCGEALALQWSDIDLDKNIIHVSRSASIIKNRSVTDESSNKTLTVITDTKTVNSDRYIPINKTALNALNQIREYNKYYGISTNYVVSNDKGEMVNERNLQRTLDRILLNGMGEHYKHHGIHALRHTMGSLLLSKGKADIKVVSEILGHSNINLTYSNFALE